jgi:hypothetical protein
MADIKEESGKGCSCGSGGGCGCGSGCRCCGGKAIKALVLLLVGGILGYLVGGHCAGYRSMCPMAGMTSSAPANPPAK